MARIQLSVPENFSFSVNIPVRITDLNYGGHVGNDSILSFMHEARVLFLKSLGYTELDVEGASLIMHDVGIEYKSELFYGDVLKVYVSATDISRLGFDLYYKLVKNEDEVLIALGKTGMVCFDYPRKKVIALPAAARQRLAGAQ